MQGNQGFSIGQVSTVCKQNQTKQKAFFRLSFAGD